MEPVQKPPVPATKKTSETTIPIKVIKVETAEKPPINQANKPKEVGKMPDPPKPPPMSKPPAPPAPPPPPPPPPSSSSEEQPGEQIFLYCCSRYFC